MSVRNGHEILVLAALVRSGGGMPLQAIASEVAGEVPKQDVASTLQRLQGYGLAFAHDQHGTLSVWGGLGPNMARYWSTRAQMIDKFGLSDSNMPKPR